MGTISQVKQKIVKTTTTIRLPQDLHFALVEKANQERRSLSAVIEIMLENQLDVSAA